MAKQSIEIDDVATLSKNEDGTIYVCVWDGYAGGEDLTKEQAILLARALLELVGEPVYIPLKEGKGEKLRGKIE